ncbi:MAG: hypothetical protein NBV67_04350 [Tagaea sp.]|nr:hypothetical protein [Tagaea sp.]
MMAGASLGLGAVQTINGLMQPDPGAAQAAAMHQQAEHQRQLMQRQFEMEERKRANLLERSQARARASFGARGLSTTDGSAGALLDGIQADADEQAADARSMFDYRLGGLDAGLASSLSRIKPGRPDLLSTGLSLGRQIGGIVQWGAENFGTLLQQGSPRGDARSIGYHGPNPRGDYGAF